MSPLIHKLKIGLAFSLVLGALTLTVTTRAQSAGPGATPPPPTPAFAERHHADNFSLARTYREPEGPAKLPFAPASPADLGSGSALAFVSARNQNDFEVFWANGYGTNLRQLTFNPADDFAPSLTRGGERVAFQTDRDGNLEIYTVNSDGNGLTRLTVNDANDYWPAWSPDNSRIVFYSYRDDNRSTSEIYVMNADGSGQTRLTYNASRDRYPNWSPDGKQIVYVNDADFVSKIWIMNADGSNQHPILQCALYCYRPTWSPDGSRILFNEDWNSDGFDDVATSNIDGSEHTPFLFSQNTTDQALPTWAPDSETIAFTVIHWNWYVDQYYWDTANIYAMNLNDRTTFSLSQTNTDWFPDWKATDLTPPTSQVSALPAWSGSTFQVSWSGSDSQSEIRAYDVQYRDGAGGIWTDWQLKTSQTQATFTGEHNHTYYFRVRARDFVANQESYSEGDGDAQTTVDGAPPVSQVSALPTWSKTTFTVLWVGSDAEIGVGSYEVQVRDGLTGTWTSWQNNTLATSAAYVGQSDHTYYFRVRAQDRFDNLEEFPAGEGDASTTVDMTPPTTAVRLIVATAPAFTARWGGQDTQSGLKAYDVLYRDGLSGNWVLWLQNTSYTSATFFGEVNHTYYFQSVGWDNLDNVENYASGNGDASVTTPAHALLGRVLNNQEQPVMAVNIQATAPALNTPLSSGGGHFALYFNQTGSYSLTVARADFGALPAVRGISVTGVTTAPTLYLPPAEETIVNGGFENNGLTSWDSSGLFVSPNITEAHTGLAALQLGGIGIAPLVTPTAPYTVSATLTQSTQVLNASNLTVHLSPNAVTTTTVFTVTNIPTVTAVMTDMQELGRNFIIQGVLSPNLALTSTLTPLTLTLTYTDTLWQTAQVITETSLQLWQFEPTTQTWQPLTGTLNTVSNTLVVTTTQLGAFAFLGRARPSGPWTSSVSQTLNLVSPATRTLSLVGRVVSATVSDTLRFYLTSATEMLTFSVPLTPSADWRHWWWPLPTGFGPTATMRVELSQAQFSVETRVLLDELSLGSTQVGAYSTFFPMVSGGKLPAQPASPSLVGWWRGENNTQDSLGVNHAIPYNGITFATGYVGQAFKLDGVDDYLEVSDTPSLRLIQSLTVSAWVFWIQPSGRLNVIIQKSRVTYAGGASYNLGIVDNKLYWGINVTGGANGDMTSLTYGVDLTTNVWHHIAGTYSGSTMSLYVDGVEWGRQSVSGLIRYDADPLTFGRYNSAYGEYFNGLIDDIRIYNYALSACEIKTLAGHACSTSELEAIKR